MNTHTHGHATEYFYAKTQHLAWMMESIGDEIKQPRRPFNATVSFSISRLPLSPYDLCLLSLVATALLLTQDSALADLNSSL